MSIWSSSRRREDTMKIEWTEEKKEAVIKRLTEWLIEHRASSGEMMYQNDECQIDAIEILSDLVDDIIKPITEDDL